MKTFRKKGKELAKSSVEEGVVPIPPQFEKDDGIGRRLDEEFYFTENEDSEEDLDPAFGIDDIDEEDELEDEEVEHVDDD